jgi:hypothetical protein
VQAARGMSVVAAVCAVWGLKYQVAQGLSCHCGLTSGMRKRGASEGEATLLGAIDGNLCRQRTKCLECPPKRLKPRHVARLCPY